MNKKELKNRIAIFIQSKFPYLGTNDLLNLSNIIDNYKEPIDISNIDVQKLRDTKSDAEFRRLLTHYLKRGK